MNMMIFVATMFLVPLGYPRSTCMCRGRSANTREVAQGDQMMCRQMAVQVMKGQRLEELFQKHPTLFGICQYHTDTLPPETVRQGMFTHKTMFVNETLSRAYPSSLPTKLLLPSSAQGRV